MAVALDPARFAIGERVPERACEPADLAALSTLLADCDARGEAAVVFGGGTLQGLGAPPERYDVAISTAALTGIVAYQPHDLTLGVWAGTKLADLARTLRRERQFVPIDAPRTADGTVGGALAAGWAGPRRRRYGAARDLVIGSTAVLADGTVAKAGGMVVKNVSGYDMSKLYIGSLGTLCALARLNFKALPLPAVQRAAIARMPDGSRERAVAHVRDLQIEPTMAVAIRGFEDEIDGRDRTDGRMILLFEGSEAAIDRAVRNVRSALGAAGVAETTILAQGALDVLQRVVDAYVRPLGGRSVTYRCTGAPAACEARAARVAALARAHGLTCEDICDLYTGDVVARISARNADAFQVRIIPFDDALHDRESHVTIFDAPATFRGRLEAWGAPPAAIATMRALKARFDPRSTLAPGRFVGGI